MQGVIVAILSAIAGSVLTYFFSRENEKKNNIYRLKREYINNVCVKIVQYLDKQNRNDSLSRNDFEELVKFIEQVYSENYLIIGEEDKSVLRGISNNIGGDLNTLVQSYAVLKNYFSRRIYIYKQKDGWYPEKEEAFISWNEWKILLSFIIIGSIIFLVCGICGILGINGWSISLFDKCKFEFFKLGLEFTDDYGPYRFLVSGIVLGVLSLYIYLKYIKHR